MQRASGRDNRSSYEIHKLKIKIRKKFIENKYIGCIINSVGEVFYTNTIFLQKKT